LTVTVPDAADAVPLKGGVESLVGFVTTCNVTGGAARAPTAKTSASEAAAAKKMSGRRKYPCPCLESEPICPRLR
jgi:hypothetical protein